MSRSDVTLTCPGCERPFTITHIQFETSLELKCPMCEHVLRKEEKYLRPALDRIEKKLSGMQDLL